MMFIKKKLSRGAFVLCLVTLVLNLKYASAQTTIKNGKCELLKLSYNAPTDQKDFGASIPLGYGRLGAKIYAGVVSEIVNLNDVTLWSGIPRSYNEAKNANILIEVRAALAVSAYKKAAF